jgi:hypothetical protein
MTLTKFAAVLCWLGVLAAPAANATVDPDESMLRPDTITLLNHVNNTFPEVPEIGGWRRDALPDHPSGRALDIMVYGDTDLGNRVAEDLRENQAEYHIRYILWQVPNHYNHVHACVD